MSRPRVVITPREGVSAERIRDWLDEHFQRPGGYDGGRTEPATDYLVRGGNPLVNAEVEIDDPPSDLTVKTALAAGLGVEHDGQALDPARVTLVRPRPRREPVSISVESGDVAIRYRRDEDGNWAMFWRGGSGWISYGHVSAPQQILWELAACVLRDEAIVGGRTGEVDAEVEEAGDGT